MMWGKKSSLSAGVSVPRLFKALAAVMCFALASSCAEDETSTQRSTTASSIVMISLDTTRPDHLSVYGYDRPTSPNLEALARDSLVMQNFVTTSSWTLPTHASLFTGLYPSTHGAHYSDTSDVALGDAEGAPGVQ